MKDPRPELIRMLAAQGYKVKNPDAMPKTARQHGDGSRCLWCCLALEANGCEVTLCFWNTPTQCVKRGFTVTDAVHSHGSDKDVYALEVKRGPHGPKKDTAVASPPRDLRELRALVVTDIEAHMNHQRLTWVPGPDAEMIANLRRAPTDLETVGSFLTGLGMRLNQHVLVIAACKGAVIALNAGKVEDAARVLAALDGLELDGWIERERARVPGA